MERNDPGHDSRNRRTVAEGAFSVEYEETAENVIINVLQADISILYTKKYRLDQFEYDFFQYADKLNANILINIDLLLLYF